MEPPKSGNDYDYYADDVPVDEAAAGAASKQRSSGLFFGVCDYRTSTVVLNVVHIFFVLFFSLVMMVMFLIERGPFLLKNLGAAFIGALVAVLVSVAGLHGAMNWKLDWLYASDVGWVLLIVVRAWKHDWLDMVVAAILLYSHIRLTILIQTGVLTVETFEVEEYVADSGREFVQIAHGYVVSSPVVSPTGAFGGGIGFGGPSVMV